MLLLTSALRPAAGSHGGPAPSSIAGRLLQFVHIVRSLCCCYCKLSDEYECVRVARDRDVNVYVRTSASPGPQLASRRHRKQSRTVRLLYTRHQCVQLAGSVDRVVPGATVVVE